MGGSISLLKMKLPINMIAIDTKQAKFVIVEKNLTQVSYDKHYLPSPYVRQSQLNSLSQPSPNSQKKKGKRERKRAKKKETGAQKLGDSSSRVLSAMNYRVKDALDVVGGMVWNEKFVAFKI